MSKTDTHMSEIDQQAADWFVLMADPQIEEDQLVAFMSWLNQLPEHEAAYERTERMWTALDCVESDFSSKDGGRIDQPTPQEKSGLGNFMHWGTAVATSLLLIVGYFSFVPGTDRLNEDYDITSLQTAVGAQKKQRLSDQSEIILNTNSQVRVAYTKDERRVYLERGEVYFDVAKQPERPFVVVVDGSEIKALGTAFNVRFLDDKQIVVSLAEGRIAVTPTADTRESVLLPGQQARYSGSNSFVRLENADLDAITQWRTGQLSFVDMPLKEVILEINRYTLSSLVLLDEEIGKQPVDAYFQIDNLENFLMGLDQLLGVESIRRGNQILLKKRKI